MIAKKLFLIVLFISAYCIGVNKILAQSDVVKTEKDVVLAEKDSLKIDDKLFGKIIYDRKAEDKWTLIKSVSGVELQPTSGTNALLYNNTEYLTTPYEVVKNLGQRILPIFLLKMLKDKKYLVPLECIDNSLPVRWKNTSGISKLYDFTELEGEILNIDELLQNMSQDSVKNVRARVVLKEVKEYDIFASAKWKEDVYFNHQKVFEVFEFEYSWNSKDGMITCDLESLQHKESRGTLGSLYAFDSAPYNLFCILEKYKKYTPELGKKMPKEVKELGRVYGFDVIDAIKKMQKESN